MSLLMYLEFDSWKKEQLDEKYLKKAFQMLAGLKSVNSTKNNKQESIANVDKDSRLGEFVI